MSVQALTWAFAVEGISVTQKAVLLALANASDDTGHCYPGQQRIAKQACVSVRTVQFALQAMESMGIIRRGHRHRDNGSRTSDEYWLDIQGEAYALRLQNQSEDDDSQSEAHACQSEAPSPLEPSEEPSEETKDIRSVDDEFALWYTKYPRKVGRGQAQRAFRAARKKKVPLQVLIDGLAGIDTSEPQFIPHPATWINGERWLDERETGPPPPPSQAEWSREVAEMVREAKERMKINVEN